MFVPKNSEKVKRKWVTRDEQARGIERLYKSMNCDAGQQTETLPKQKKKDAYFRCCAGVLGFVILFCSYCPPY